MDLRYKEIDRTQYLRRRLMNEMILRHHACPIAPDALNREKLAGIKQLHIIGTADLYPGEIFPFMGQCYMDQSGQWLLLFEVSRTLLGRIVAECAPGLEKLDIRYTNWNNIDLLPFGSLRCLELSDMRQLQSLGGLETLCGLEALSVGDVPLGDRLDVSKLSNLRVLKLRNARQLKQLRGLQMLCHLEHLELKKLEIFGDLDLSGNKSLQNVVLHDLGLGGICLDGTLEKLEYMDVTGVPVADVGFLRNLTNLRKLILSDTKIADLPDLADLSGLETLDLSRSPIREIKGLPAGIRELYLGNTRLKRIPGFLRELKQLRWLDLSQLRLEALPAWLPELNPTIAVDEFYRDGDGIWLYGTTVPGADLTALMLPREAGKRELSQQKARLWFESRDREEPSLVNEYRSDSGVLEFHMEFDALPNGLIDRLWMKRFDEVDRECTWAEGTRLVHGKNGVSAVVVREGNVLKCFVRRSDRSAQLHDYLSMIKADADTVAGFMKLRCLDCWIMHKTGGRTVAFSYDELLRKHQYGERKITSGLMLYAPYIEDILNQNNRPVDEDRDKLVEDLAGCFEKMQNRSKYRDVAENDYNDAVVDFLENKGYIVSDQPRGGASGNNGGVGQVDMSIRKPMKPNKPWTLYEGLILTGKSPSQLKNWENHLIKVMNNYNHKGLPFVLLASYVKCSMVEFKDYCKAYFAHLSTYAPSDYYLCSAEEMNLDVAGYQQNEFVRVAVCTYRRANCDQEQDGFVRTVYHFFARFGV